MTLLDLLSKAAGSAAGLIKLLEKVAVQAPDLAPLAQEWIFKLNAAVDMKNLVNVASALPKEIANIAQGKIDSRTHPSDGI